MHPSQGREGRQFVKHNLLPDTSTFHRFVPGPTNRAYRHRAGLLCRGNLANGLAESSTNNAQRGAGCELCESTEDADREDQGDASD